MDESQQFPNQSPEQDSRHELRDFLRKLVPDKVSAVVVADNLRVSISSIYGWKSDEERKWTSLEKAKDYLVRLREFEEAVDRGEVARYTVGKDLSVQSVERRDNPTATMIYKLTARRGNIQDRITELRDELLELEKEEENLRVTIETLRSLEGKI